jgi:hypothetical protein
MLSLNLFVSIKIQWKKQHMPLKTNKKADEFNNYGASVLCYQCNRNIKYQDQENYWPLILSKDIFLFYKFFVIF